MSAVAGIRMKSPANPGGVVKHEVVEPHSLTVTDPAHILGVTRPALSALLGERATRSPEMGRRFDKTVGVPMDTLIRMLNGYVIAEARKGEGEINRARLAGKPVKAAAENGLMALCSISLYLA